MNNDPGKTSGKFEPLAVPPPALEQGGYEVLRLPSRGGTFEWSGALVPLRRRLSSKALVATGIWLTFVYDPSPHNAYASVIGFQQATVIGYLMRQVHHWAAVVFVAAIIVHMARIFFTAAYRKPREINWVAGVLMLVLGVLGLLGFWAVFLFFASAGVDAVAVPGAHSATALLLAFLPPLFAALLILIAGWLLANFLSQMILIAAVNARLPEARLPARAAHWAVILFAVATALTHLGIGKEMVLVAFGITFGGLVLALALAFGLGGRAIAADILARRLRRESPPPQERLTHL